VAGVHALFPALYGWNLWQHGSEAGDWWFLRLVARHFVAGDIERLYAVGAQALDPQYFWRYPPFALFFVAPLAMVPDHLAHGCVILVQLVALGASMVLMARLVDLRGYAIEWALAIALSAPFFSVLVTGQNSALITLCVVGAAALLASGRPAWAGLLLGLLAVKPNWGAFFFAYLVVAAQWRGAAAMICTTGALCLTTLLLPAHLWRDFVRISLASDQLLSDYEAFKLITLKGFLDASIGRGLVATGLWVVATVCLVAAAITVWRRPASPLRHLGTVVLLAVAVNPYASFYDALLLAVPATAWWGIPATHRRGAWRVIGLLVVTAWLGQQVAFGWLPLLVQRGITWVPPWSLVGPVAAVWLCLEAIEVRHFRPTPACTDSAMAPT
jgi:hypothetical protein